jgi:hypothetical protein
MEDSHPSVVVTVKSPQSATGDSYVTRYISESNLATRREGEIPRLLFTESQDGLNWMDANESLSNKGSAPSKRDIIHLTITFKSEDYIALADTEEERLKAVRSITRTVMKTVEAIAQVESLRWAAGIHRNTDQPHVHIAISKEAVEAGGSRTKRIEKLPPELFAHVRTAATESDQSAGLLAATFATSLRAAASIQL